MIVLDKPIDLLALSKYVRRGRNCIADVYGYRSDLVVVMCTGSLIMLRSPNGNVFNTDIRYVRSVTVT